MKNCYLLHAASALIIAMIASLLYIPFLGNAVIFDDHGIFTSLRIYDYAQSIFGPRAFPYFTLGFIEVLTGSLEANRIVSLVLHIFCALMLYTLLTSLLHQVSKTSMSVSSEKNLAFGQSNTLAFILSVWFVIHPVAVYGAGYLTQRTILFATLFALISLWFYHRAFVSNRLSDIVVAALFYAAAIFSKEHVIMLPLAAVTLTALYSGDIKSRARWAVLYLSLCLPAAVWVFLSINSVVASSYEPHVGIFIPLIDGIPLLNKPWGPWLVSMTIQVNLFFEYIGYWLVPDIRFMSADMRIDFAEMWGTGWLFPKAALFLTCPFIAMYLLRRGGLMTLFGCGLLYSWLLFLTELVAVRFREPFVLYRSYLWMPGYTLMLAAICRALPIRWVMAIATPILLICFSAAHERLGSLVSEGSVWKDAAVKLKSESLLGADRIFYNRGLEYLRERKFDDAVSDFSHSIQQNSTISQNYYSRGTAYYLKKEFAKALADFNYALILNKKFGRAQYARGLIFERMGCIEEAKNAYILSRDLGVLIASPKLDELKKSEQSEKKQRYVPTSAICSQ